jgi:hypothetical protein
MSGYVRAMALTAEVTQVSDGSDTAVVFDGFTDSKIDVSSFIRLSLYANVGASGADITVKGYRTLNAPAEDIYAKTTNAADGVILDAESIEGYAYVEVYEDGTDSEAQVFYLLAK